MFRVISGDSKEAQILVAGQRYLDRYRYRYLFFSDRTGIDLSDLFLYCKFLSIFSSWKALINITVPVAAHIQNVSISVVDPKLFFSDPDSDPIFVRVLDPDSDPDPLWLVKITDPVSDPTLNILSFPMSTIKKAFSWYFKAYRYFLKKMLD
jgi:hypothetical protein